MVCIPPSSHVGVHPDRVTRAGRDAGWVSSDDTVLVTLGQIRRYMGEAAAANPHLGLPVAGSMVRHPDGPALSVAAMAVAFADPVAPLWEFTEP